MADPFASWCHLRSWFLHVSTFTKNHRPGDHWDHQPPSASVFSPKTDPTECDSAAPAILKEMLQTCVKNMESAATHRRPGYWRRNPRQSFAVQRRHLKFKDPRANGKAKKWRKKTPNQTWIFLILDDDGLYNQVLKCGLKNIYDVLWKFQPFSTCPINGEEPAFEAWHLALLWLRTDHLSWAKRNGKWSKTMVIWQEHYVCWLTGIPTMAGWWFQPLWKICSSVGII